MKRYLLLFVSLFIFGTSNAQNPVLRDSGNSNTGNALKIGSKSLSTSGVKKQFMIGQQGLVNDVSRNVEDTTLLPLSPNGNLLSVDGYEVDFRLPSNPAISNVCGTKRPYIDNAVGAKSAGCPFSVPCDNPANRDAATTTVKYFQLVWHVMQSTTGGVSSNIDQTRIDDLMAELNADYATNNMIFCADPATFYVDDINYNHDSNTEEVSLKTTYNVNPTQLINIYVVGAMTAGGYARFPYDPMGGTSTTGGIVLNRGNCNVGTHTLAHEMGHTFGLEHTFSGVDERVECSACYEQVRNVNGSSNASGVATPFGGPYAQEGDQEGDWCSDTNPHDTYSYNCFTSSNSNGTCDTNPWANAPVSNHMSYSFCSSQFSPQQQLRMHCMTDTYLGSWIGYGGGICGTQPPNADFTGNPTTWQAPANVNFTDLSQPTAIITSWTWVFDVAASNSVTCVGCTGTNATFVGQTPPAVTYPNVGLYTVSLAVTSANGPDAETKLDYIEVLAPAGDCDTLDIYWTTPTSTPTIYGGLAAGEHILCTPDLVNSPTNGDKGAYERYITPNPGVTEVGALRVGLAELGDADDDMVFQVSVYDDNGSGQPGTLLGGSNPISPTAIGVPISGSNSFQEYWIPFTPVTPTTATFHIGIEVFPGDLTDELVLVASSNALGDGQANGLNHIWSEDFGYENLLGDYGLNVDLDLVPMLGGYTPLPLITGFTEDVVCDTTYVTLFDTALYSSPVSWSFTFLDGTVINSVTDPMTIDRVYTAPGPDIVQVAVINECGRADTTYWSIPYNFMSTPDAEFTSSPLNPVCEGAPGVTFTANTSDYMDYSWDFGDGTPIVSSGSTDNINHPYALAGTYYVELTVTSAGVTTADTFYLENFEAGWPAGYARFNNDVWTPDPGVNPPFTGTDATAWLPLDMEGDGDVEAVSTSWNLLAGQLADDWMCTSDIGVLPPNQRLYWDGEASDINFPDGYEVRISTTGQLPANAGNYSVVLFSIAAENAASTTHSVDLSAYAGQTINIAFINNSDWMNLLAIDNIRIGTADPGCTNSVLYTDYVEIIDCTTLPPVTVLSADVTAGCNPVTVTFTDATTVGDPATSWLWNFGDASFSTLQNPPPHLYATAGSYFVIFESCNAGGCTQDTITILVGDPATIVLVASNDPTCTGNDGDITITATGGTGTLQYSIDNGVTYQASNVFGGLADGTYDIVVEDALGCQATSSVTLSPAPVPSITNVATNDPSCFGGTDGDITITASGGTGALSYSIDNGVTFQAGNSFSGLGAANYDIVVEDALGCQVATTATLTDPPQVVITLVTSTDPTCNGDTDGDITISASGGTGALQYSIDNGVTFQAGNSFSSLGGATYNIIVEDVNGCQANTIEVLSNPPTVTISNVVGTNPTCNGGTNGSIVITAAGGTGVLLYSIDNGVTFQAGNTFAGLGAGSYSIVVEDAVGCQATSNATLSNPAAVSITNVATTDPTCNGGTDGDITITASGGTGALSYSIDNGVTFQAGNNFAGLGAGTYDLVVEDAVGCQATTSVILTTPSAVAITNIATTDPTCNSGTDGDITITASGGTGALQYSIDNGVTFQAGNSFSSLSAAAYDIVVEDAVGCQVTSSVTLTDPASVSYTVTITDESCGAIDGQLVFTGAGGDGGPYSYSIDNGVTFQGSNTFNGLAAATYTIIVEDASGCQVVSTETVGGTVSISITSVTLVDATCNGGTDGSITIIAAGGNGAIQYSIDNGVTFQAGNNFPGLGAGSYDVVIEDAVGCQATSTEVLTAPSAVTITNIATTGPTCNGGADGDITITASGGTGALTYSIDNGVTFQAGNSFSSLSAATYDIVVEDAVGCQVTSSVTLTDPASVSYTVTITDESCGAIDGQLVFTGAGGDGGPYSYSIDNGVTFQGSNTFNGLSAATYNVIVEDASGCQVVSTETVGGTVSISITSVTLVDATCNGGTDGSITIIAAGGNGAIQYSIDNGVTFQAGNNFPGLGAGTYDVVIEDAVGCQATTTETLTAPSAINITLVASTDPTCNGGNDGDITITASGGTGVLQYSIDNGVTFQAGNSFSSLSAATYDIVVEDAVGCQVTSSVTLTNPAAVSYGEVVTDENCGAGDGQIVMTGAGGDGGPYSYSIDNGVTFQASGTFNGLVAGPYNVIVEDASGCQIPGIVTVNGTGGATITGITIDNSLLCNGDCNGQMTATVTGGILPYVYTWVDGLSGAVGGNSATISSLCADTYTLTVVDNAGAGCTVVLSQGLSEPALVTYTTTITDENCGTGNGQIVISAAAGGDGGPYTYSNDNGVTFQAGNTFAGLSAASYDIVVEDGNGCQGSSTVTVNSIAGPSIISVATTDPLCGAGNGDITITASGGVGAIQYSIDNGVTFQAGNNFAGLGPATYNIVIEDGNGCQDATTLTLTDPGAPNITSVTENDPTCGLNNGDITINAAGGTGALTYSIDNGVTFQGGTSFASLGAATYNIVVEDALGCQATSISVLTNPGAPSISVVTPTDPTCGNSDGQIDITASGGTPALQYSIDNGVTFQAGSNFAGLLAATYDIVVEDAAGCQVSTTVTLTNTLAPSITSISTTDPLCGAGNGDITITASGGVGALQYSIDNGVTFQGGNNFAGLGPATYNIVVEDVNGCQDVSVVTLTDLGAPSITSVTSNDPTCGLNNGDITVTGTGGTPSLQYSIDNGVTFQGTNSFTSLADGTYNIIVEDALGCQAASISVLTNPGAPSITLVTPTDPTCGNSDGQIDITTSGGTPALQYSIDNGVTFQAGNVFAGLTAALYNIVVEDGAGCQVSTTTTLINTAAPTISNVSTTDPGCGAGDGIITITASGGTGALQYSIDNGVTFQVGNNFTGLGAATYIIVVEDAVGCQATTTVTLTDLGAPSITSVTTNDPTCGNPNGDLTINATGGTGALQYSIDNGVTFQGSNNFAGLAGATYTIVVEDALGCSVSTTATLTNAGSPTISNVVTTDPTCGLSNGDITITASGGTGALLYSIDNGVTFQASNFFAGLGVATYTLVVEDAIGCQSSQVVSLTSVGSAVITGVAFTEPTCGLPNGDITINATGGTGVLTYSINGGTTFQGSNLFGGLTAGSYVIVVEDAIGCQTFGATITLTDPGSPVIDGVVANDPTCGNNDGDITINASGGTGAITYSIDNGVTFQAGNFFGTLPTGLYDIVIEDAIGCQTSMGTMALVDLGSPTITSISLTQPACGNPDGAITIVATGGTGTLNYSIDNGVTFQASGSFTGLADGTYDIVVEDANGCSVTSTEVLNPSTAPVITIDAVTDVLCFGDSTGAVAITVTGGQGPFTFDWDNDGTGDFDDAEDLTNAFAGNFAVVVMDALGCTANASGTINGASEIILSATTTPETLGNDGAINLTVTGGVSPYSFDWDNDGVGDNDDTEDLNSLAGNLNYTVIVTDQNGCTDTLLVFVDSNVGLSDITEGMGISIFPNPNSGEFDVTFANYTGQATMEVVDMAGRLVYKDVKSVKVGESYNVNLLSAADGVYFLNIKSEVGIHSVRIIKQ
ncbi:MAG: PKD domain-containing protein [Crocinitomicaceae bacterium]|nr:PKD domain-containing protein [Crocinitomicaceae bacterium]